MIYTTEMMRTLARQHDEDSDTRAALMQAADKITHLQDTLYILLCYEKAVTELTPMFQVIRKELGITLKGE